MKLYITYRKTSSLSIRIDKKYDVRVSAPIGYPKEEIMKFVESKKDWINEARQHRYEQEKKRYEFFNQLPLDTEVEFRAAVNRLFNIISPLVKKYSELMGLETPFYKCGTTISKWGSCDARNGVVQFSIYLLLLPDWCIEHVVVHELAHLIEANHGPRFYAIMDKYFPRWREARAETRRLSRMESDE